MDAATPRANMFWWSVLGIAVVAGAIQRGVAVERLPPDFDELIYLPVAYDYRDLAAEGKWAELARYDENHEHPPGVKLLFAASVAATGAPEPDWDKIKVGRPMPQEAEAAFAAGRWLSWAFGVVQLGLIGSVSPAGALGLAFSSYHTKYTAQAYLEAVPGLWAMVAVLLFERALRRRPPGMPGLGADAEERPLRKAPFLLSALALGLATAGKYPYGLVVTLALAPFLFFWARGKIPWWFAYAGVALAAFFLADPYLWPDPLGRLAESVGFHWDYSSSEHVKKSALPWYQPFYWFTHSEPTQWHQGVFLTPVADWVLLPLAFAGLGRTLRVRPIFAVWLIVGLLFLVAWPTKWPQYILLVLPAVAVCAGMGVQAIALRFASAGRWSKPS